MVEYLKKWLKELEVSMPPGLGHHSLTFARYGSPRNGWEDKLALTIQLPLTIPGDTRIVFFLDEGDLERTAGDVASELISEIRKQRGSSGNW